MRSLPTAERDTYLVAVVRRVVAAALYPQNPELLAVVPVGDRSRELDLVVVLDFDIPFKEQGGVNRGYLQALFDQCHRRLLRLDTDVEIGVQDCPCGNRTPYGVVGWIGETPEAADTVQSGWHVTSTGVSVAQGEPFG